MWSVLTTHYPKQKVVQCSMEIAGLFNEWYQVGWIVMWRKLYLDLPHTTHNCRYKIKSNILKEIIANCDFGGLKNFLKKKWDQ